MASRCTQNQKGYRYCYRCPTQCQEGRLLMLQEDVDTMPDMDPVTKAIALDAIETLTEELRAD